MPGSIQDFFCRHLTVRDRILARGEEEGCWRMENIEMAREGAASVPEVLIQTEEKSVEERCDPDRRMLFVTT